LADPFIHIYTCTCIASFPQYSHWFSVIEIPLPLQESHHYPRGSRPHGATFLGHPLALTISTDSSVFTLNCHSNENLLSLKEKIAQKLNTNPEQLQIGTTDKWLDVGDNNKLVHQLGFTDQQTLSVKLHSNISGTHSKVTDVSCMDMHNMHTMHTMHMLTNQVVVM